MRVATTVNVGPAAAFAAFTDGFAAWWPPEYTWSGATLVDIGIEPHAGGACYEQGPHGFTCHWGRVLDWQPPARLVFSWQISPRREPVPDPDKASEVVVQFAPDANGGTRVTLEHRHFERHGDGAADYRAGMASPQGWSWLIERYAAAL